MDYLGRFISFLTVLALFGPSAALAQGSVTGITWEPATVATCTLEKITVTGTGSCPGGTISLDAGDNTPIPHVPGVSFPIGVYHTYTKARTYTLTAQGQGTCSGTITTSLSVLGPTVTSVYPFSVIKPLGGVILQGQHFGSLPGQIWIHLTDYRGNPINLQLEGIQWGDTFVAGSIPYIDGVLKQTATFTIVTQCGASTTWEATFTPIIDVLVLIPWERLACSISIGLGVSDSCQTSGGNHWPIECGLGGPPFTTGVPPGDLQGWHASGWGGGSSGYDRFWPSPPLQNGWVYDNDTYTISWYDLGGGSYLLVTGVNTSNSATPVLGANWHADACGLVEYSGDMYITGPHGVPY
jgi:hypothetical protein